MDNLINLWKVIQEQTNNKIGVSDFILKAVAQACLKVPETNS